MHNIFCKKFTLSVDFCKPCVYDSAVAKTSIPAIEPGTERAALFASCCRNGWNDAKLAAEFDFSPPTVRKYRELLAPETTRRALKAAQPSEAGS